MNNQIIEQLTNEQIKNRALTDLFIHAKNFGDKYLKLLSMSPDALDNYVKYLEGTNQSCEAENAIKRLFELKDLVQRADIGFLFGGAICR